MFKRHGASEVRVPLRQNAARARAKVSGFLFDLPKLHILSTSWLLVIGALFLLARWEPVQAAAVSLTSYTPAAAQPAVAADPRDVRLLAATVWAEARSEGEKGMRAVAHVMVNRMGPRFGAGVEDVVLAPRQFSAWNVGDPNRPLALNPERYASGGVNRITWLQAQQIAREVLEGRSVDPTQGALFYHTHAVRPSWSRYGVGKRSIGAHVFYADVPDLKPRRPWEAPSSVVAQAESGAPAPTETPAAPRVQSATNEEGRVSGTLQGSI